MTKTVYALAIVGQSLLLALLVAAVLAGSAPWGLLAAAGVAAAVCVAADALLVRKVRESVRAELAAERVRILEEQLGLQKEYRAALEQEAAQAQGVLEAMAGELRQLDEQLRSGDSDACVQDACRTMLLPARSRLCENVVVDALLTAKLQACERAGIRAAFRVEVPQDVPLPAVDVCATFSNVLDNAINACEAVGQGERWVDVRARIDGGYLVVKASNSCSPAAAEAQAASARGGAPFREHGWGLTILQGLADRYDGSLSTQQSGETWQTALMLKTT